MTITRTMPLVTIETYRDPFGRLFHQARCAANHTSGWCASEAQARSFLWSSVCEPCQAAFIEPDACCEHPAGCGNRPHILTAEAL